MPIAMGQPLTALEVRHVLHKAGDLGAKEVDG